MRLPCSICAEKEPPTCPVQDIARRLLCDEKVSPFPPFRALLADASPLNPLRSIQSWGFSYEQLPVLGTVEDRVPSQGSASRGGAVIPFRETINGFRSRSGRGVEEVRDKTTIATGLGLLKLHAFPSAEFSVRSNHDILPAIDHTATLCPRAAGRGLPEDKRFSPGVERYRCRTGIVSLYFEISAEVGHEPGAVRGMGKRLPALQHS